VACLPWGKPLLNISGEKKKITFSLLSVSSMKIFIAGEQDVTFGS